MRPIYGLLALAALLFGLGSAQGWSMLHTLAYGLLLTIALSYAWSWWSVRAIYVRPRPKMLRSQVGSYVRERSEVENLSWLPKPWLEVLDASDHPEHNLSQVLSLGPLGRRVREVRTACRQRGQFTLGPVWLAGGDPFALFPRERQVLGRSTLVVFPATVQLPSFGRLPGELTGGSLQGERVHFTTPNVASVRDYQPGDSYNRVHWPSTARLGKLIVKEFERDPFSDLWLVLDLDGRVQVGSDEESTEEYAVTAAASLARHFLLNDRAVGIATQGHRLPVDRGPRQLMRVLDFLAVARPYRGQSLQELLLAEAQSFGRRDNLVVLTATPDTEWVSLCRDLALRGVRSSAVLLEASTFRGAAPNAGPPAEVTASGIPTYVIKRGADLSVCLSQPVLAATSSFSRATAGAPSAFGRGSG
jgi:uncharacterized protein (DUF58 family)